MSLHINKFIDKVSAHDARGQQDFVMTMRDARNLAWDIAKLLAKLQETATRPQQDQGVNVDLSGGQFR